MYTAGRPARSVEFSSGRDYKNSGYFCRYPCTLRRYMKEKKNERRKVTLCTAYIYEYNTRNNISSTPYPIQWVQSELRVRIFYTALIFFNTFFEFHECWTFSVIMRAQEITLRCVHARVQRVYSKRKCYFGIPLTSHMFSPLRVVNVFEIKKITALFVHDITTCKNTRVSSTRIGLPDVLRFNGTLQILELYYYTNVPTKCFGVVKCPRFKILVIKILIFNLMKKLIN